VYHAPISVYQTPLPDRSQSVVRSGLLARSSIRPERLGSCRSTIELHPQLLPVMLVAEIGRCSELVRDTHETQAKVYQSRLPCISVYQRFR
jgi:hypothetical protein